MCSKWQCQEISHEDCWNRSTKSQPFCHLSFGGENVLFGFLFCSSVDVEGLKIVPFGPEAKALWGKDTINIPAQLYILVSLRSRIFLNWTPRSRCERSLKGRCNYQAFQFIRNFSLELLSFQTSHRNSENPPYGPDLVYIFLPDFNQPQSFSLLSWANDHQVPSLDSSYGEPQTHISRSLFDILLK